MVAWRRRRLQIGWDGLGLKRPSWRPGERPKRDGMRGELVVGDKYATGMYEYSVIIQRIHLFPNALTAIFPRYTQFSPMTMYHFLHAYWPNCRHQWLGKPVLLKNACLWLLGPQDHPAPRRMGRLYSRNPIQANKTLMVHPSKMSNLWFRLSNQREVDMKEATAIDITATMSI